MVDKKEKKEKPVSAKKQTKNASVKTPKETKIVAKPTTDPFDTVKFVLMTEKSVRAIEAQNKLVFIVRRNAKRNEVKQSVEQMFSSPVSDVTTLIDQSGRKKAFVSFKNAGAAGDIAIKLGII